MPGKFQKLVEQNRYVDKTNFIKALLQKYIDKVSVFIQPSGFGKSVMMDMLDKFFNMRYQGSQYNFFASLNISNEKEIVAKHQWQYPVILLDFSQMKKYNTYKEFENSFRTLVRNIYKQFEFIINDLSEDLRDIFVKIFEHDDFEIHYTLTDLVRCIAYYQRRKNSKFNPIILIDGYDDVLADAFLYGYWDAAESLISRFFLVSFKGYNSGLYDSAILFGSSALGKKDLSYALNKATLYYIDQERYSEYFGFSQQEILLLSNKIEWKKLFENCGNYFINGIKRFNPKGVMHVLFNQYEYTDEKIEKCLTEFITPTNVNILSDFRKLMNGEVIDITIDYNVSIQPLPSKDDTVTRSTIWSLLYLSGYLTTLPTLPSKDYDRERYLIIPNYTSYNWLVRELLPSIGGKINPDQCGYTPCKTVIQNWLDQYYSNGRLWRVDVEKDKKMALETLAHLNKLFDGRAISIDIIKEFIENSESFLKTFEGLLWIKVKDDYVLLQEPFYSFFLKLALSNQSDPQFVKKLNHYFLERFDFDDVGTQIVKKDERLINLIYYYLNNFYREVDKKYYQKYMMLAYQLAKYFLYCKKDPSNASEIINFIARFQEYHDVGVPYLFNAEITLLMGECYLALGYHFTAQKHLELIKGYLKDIDESPEKQQLSQRTVDLLTSIDQWLNDLSDEIKLTLYTMLYFEYTPTTLNINSDNALSAFWRSGYLQRKKCNDECYILTIEEECREFLKHTVSNWFPETVAVEVLPIMPLELQHSKVALFNSKVLDHFLRYLGGGVLLNDDLIALVIFAYLGERPLSVKFFETFLKKACFEKTIKVMSSYALITLNEEEIVIENAVRMGLQEWLEKNHDQQSFFILQRLGKALNHRLKSYSFPCKEEEVKSFECSVYYAKALFDLLCRSRGLTKNLIDLFSTVCKFWAYISDDYKELSREVKSFIYTVINNKPQLKNHLKEIYQYAKKRENFERNTDSDDEEIEEQNSYRRVYQAWNEEKEQINAIQKDMQPLTLSDILGYQGGVEVNKAFEGELYKEEKSILRILRDYHLCIFSGIQNADKANVVAYQLTTMTQGDYPGGVYWLDMHVTQFENNKNVASLQAVSLSQCLQKLFACHIDDNRPEAVISRFKNLTAQLTAEKNKALFIFVDVYDTRFIRTCLKIASSHCHVLCLTREAHWKPDDQIKINLCRSWIPPYNIIEKALKDQFNISITREVTCDVVRILYAHPFLLRQLFEHLSYLREQKRDSDINVIFEKVIKDLKDKEIRVVMDYFIQSQFERLEKTENGQKALYRFQLLLLAYFFEGHLHASYFEFDLIDSIELLLKSHLITAVSMKGVDDSTTNNGYYIYDLQRYVIRNLVDTYKQYHCGLNSISQLVNLIDAVLNKQFNEELLPIHSSLSTKELALLIQPVIVLYLNNSEQYLPKESLVIWNRLLLRAVYGLYRQRCFYEASQILDKVIKESTNLPECYILQGMIAYQINNRNVAAQAFQNAYEKLLQAHLNHFAKLHDIIQTIISLKIELPKVTKSYFQQGIENARKLWVQQDTKHYRLMITLLNRWSLHYLKESNKDVATGLVKQAISLLEKYFTNEDYEQANAQYILGQLAFLEKDYTLAHKLYDKAEAICITLKIDMFHPLRQSIYYQQVLTFFARNDGSVVEGIKLYLTQHDGFRLHYATELQLCLAKFEFAQKRYIEAMNISYKLLRQSDFYENTLIGAEVYTLRTSLFITMAKKEAFEDSSRAFTILQKIFPVQRTGNIEAIKDYKRVVHPIQAKLMYYLGMAAQQRGEWGDASSLYNEAYEIYLFLPNQQYNPEIAHILLRLGKVYHLLADYDKAIKSLNEANRIQELPEIYCELVHIYCDLANYPAAKKNLTLALNSREEKQALTADQAFAQARYWYTQGDYDKAKQLLQETLKNITLECEKGIGHENDDTMIQLKLLLVQVEYQQGFYSEALNALYNLLELNSKKYSDSHFVNAPLYHYIGSIYLIYGELKVAEEYLTMAEKIASQYFHNEIHPERLKIHREMNVFTANKNPNNASYASEKLDSPPTLQTIDNLLKRGTAYPFILKYYITLINAYLYKKDLENAKQLIDKALKMYNESFRMRPHIFLAELLSIQAQILREESHHIEAFSTLREAYRMLRILVSCDSTKLVKVKAQLRDLYTHCCDTINLERPIVYYQIRKRPDYQRVGDRVGYFVSETTSYYQRYLQAAHLCEHFLHGCFNFKKAQEWLNTAIFNYQNALPDGIIEPIWIRLRVNQAYIYHLTGNDRKSIKVIDETIRQAKKLTNVNSELAYAFRLKAEMYIYLNRLDDAKINIDNAQEQLLSCSSPQLGKNAQKNLQIEDLLFVQTKLLFDIASSNIDHEEIFQVQQAIMKRLQDYQQKNTLHATLVICQFKLWDVHLQQLRNNIDNFEEYEKYFTAYQQDAETLLDNYQKKTGIQLNATMLGRQLDPDSFLFECSKIGVNTF